MYNHFDARVLTCGYSYHSQPFHSSSESLKHYLFRLQTEGRARVLIDGEMTEVQSGDLLLYKPGSGYRLAIEEHDNHLSAPSINSGDYYLFCQGDWVDEWWNRATKPVKTRIVIDDKLLALWRMLISEKLKFEQANEELLGYLFRSLCLMINAAMSPAPFARGSLFTAARMKSFIEENAALPFKIGDVARHVSLSVSRAVHLFKACYGKTMIEYALEVRLSIALERMAYSIMTLEQIAESCGFGSYSYFHRVFREKYGHSPTAYRDRLRKGSLRTE